MGHGAVTVITLDGLDYEIAIVISHEIEFEYTVFSSLTKILFLPYAVNGHAL